MNKLALILATSALLVGSRAALAQGSPDAYVSLSAGFSHANLDCTDATTCDRSSAAARVLAGYRITPNFAIEASYAYLGRAKATSDLDGSVATVSINGQSLGVGVAGLFPFGEAKAWTGIARAGIASNRARASATLDGESASDSETHAEPYFGLGLNYAFTPNFEAGIAWDSTKLKYADVSARVNVFSLVGTFRF